MIKIPTKIDQAKMRDRFYCFGFLKTKGIFLTNQVLSLADVG